MVSPQTGLPITSCRHRSLRASNNQTHLGLLSPPALVTAVGGRQQRSQLHRSLPRVQQLQPEPLPGSAGGSARAAAAAALQPRPGTASCITAWSCTAPCITAWSCTASRSILHHGRALHSILQHPASRHGPAQHHAALHSLSWHLMALQGLTEQHMAAQLLHRFHFFGCSVHLSEVAEPAAGAVSRAAALPGSPSPGTTLHHPMCFLARAALSRCQQEGGLSFSIPTPAAGTAGLGQDDAARGSHILQP